VGVTSFSFANGAKIFVKPTDFKNDEIVFTAIGEGGLSVYPDEDHYSASYAGVMVNVMGVADFSPSDLRKILAGKNVSVTPNIGTYSQNISGSTSPKDLETTLQLIHLYFKQVRKDKELFDIYMDNQKSQLATAQVNPDYQFSKALNRILANGNLRAKGIYDPEELDKVDLDRGLEIFADRFSNAADFEFYFTGNLDLDSLKPMLERYIGSLTGNPGKKDDFVDMGIRAPRGAKELVSVGTDEKSQVILYFSGETPYDRKKAADISYLGDILTIKLIENLREEIGGVYGVGANGSISIQPVGTFSFSVSFPCSPDQVEELIQAAWAEIKQIQENGPTQDDLNKVKEKRRIALAENLERNSYWNAQLAAIRTYDLPWNVILNAETSISEMTPDRIQKAAEEFLTKENLLEILKYPSGEK
jgi:zinc protease